MDVRVVADSTLGEYDMGGGCCDMTVVISYDPAMPKRLQRRAVVHEALEVLFGYVLSHEKIEDAEDVICDALEQWEGYEGSDTKGD